MPAQYSLRASSFNAGMVGSNYHLGLSDGTNTYGYVIRNFGATDERSYFNESSNIADKEKLIQYSSSALIDRDLAFYPRVSQGDFSGGLLQVVFVDPAKEFDSDLEIRTPGYLMLRPAWQRQVLNTGGVGGGTPQSVAWNNDVYTGFNNNINLLYNSAGTQFSPAPGITCRFVDTDGNSLIVGDGVNTIRTYFSSWSSIATAAGAFTQLWLVNQGTNGRFVYYAVNTANDINSGADALYRVDMTAFPVTAGTLVPTNLTRYSIVDLCEHQNGIAILTNDPGGTGLDVWYHDGVNMVRIVRVNQYLASGICPCLGDLYVTATSTGQFEAPVLMKISAGSFEVVVRTGSPLALQTNAAIGAPESSGQYVCFALSNPQISGVTMTNYIGVYDSISGSYSHLGSLDGLDAPGTSQPRQLAFSGRSVTFPMISGNNGYLQYQSNSSRLPAGTPPQPFYAASGWVVSSRIDFNTPGIAKRFRRIEVHHSPLAAGESIQVNAYVDIDPLSWTQALSPRPTVATVTNSTVGSDVTVLALGNDATATGTNVGRSLIYAIKLTAGTNQATTPKVAYTAVEVGGTWVWEFDLDCTSSRRLLNQAGEDLQGVTGKDLYFLLRNAYENGQNLTLLLAGLSYTVNVESLKAQAPSYVNHQGTSVQADEEWLVHCVLKQELS